MRRHYAKLWLEFAEEDLEASRILVKRGLIRTATYHLQQVVEKSLKALLILQGAEIPRTHDIERLMNLLSSSYTIPRDLWDAVNLTEYAFTTRYPDDYEPIGEEEYESVYEIAVRVYKWAKGIVEGQP